MKVTEIYRSIQGEGRLTGTESVFVRASGCNLRCWFCDTPYASWSPEGSDLSIDEIVAAVEEWDCRHVVLTGGEPMLFAELIPLATQLHEAGRHITIETAGTLLLPVVCDLMSVSPKLSNSTPSVARDPRWSRRHQRVRHAPDVLRKLVAEYEYQIKYVVDTPADAAEVEQHLRQFPEIERDRVMLMPQGTDVETLAVTSHWLEPFCQENEYQFCPRRQIEWFGKARKT